MADFWYKCSLVVAPRIVVALIRVWFATCRVRVLGDTEMRDILAHHQTGIAAFWHYSFLYIFYHLRKYSAAVMVSASRDGEYIARVAKLMGHVPVRGSSNQRGFRALREMIELMSQGYNAGIVADGSQGPARKVQAGCILMASKSGRPIFPMVWAADRYLRFNSWDRTLVPLPFATIVLHHGEPLYVPGQLSSEQIEAYRLELEHRLNTLYQAVWQALGKPAHDAA